MGLKGKIILVTGGARRVGAVISRYLAEEGAHVVIHYHTSANSARDLKREMESSGYSVDTVPCNLSSVDEIRRMVVDITARHGTIDCLVGNASVYYRTPFFDVTENQWDEILAVNLKSYFFLCQEVGRQMKLKKEGKIVLISDVSGEIAWPNYFPYTISKAGINHLVHGLAKILAPEIQVNAIAPGTVLPSEKSSEKDIAFFRERTLLKRIGSPEDIARVVGFLLVDANYITGTVIPVDGGFRLEGL